MKARIPSIDMIEQRTGYDRETCIKIRRILDGRDDPLSYPRTAKQLGQWFWGYDPTDSRQRVEAMMMAVDEVMDACGIEVLRCADEWDRYYHDVVVKYVNVGETYHGTILYDVDRGVFYAMSVGDFQETAENNGRYRFV